MSGKGSAPRPFSVSDDVYSANWGLIFGEHRGVAERSKATGSNPVMIVGSNPTAAATYVDDATGQIVDENFWPDTRNHNG